LKNRFASANTLFLNQSACQRYFSHLKEDAAASSKPSGKPRKADKPNKCFIFTFLNIDARASSPNSRNRGRVNPFTLFYFKILYRTLNPDFSRPPSARVPRADDRDVPHGGRSSAHGAFPSDTGPIHPRTGPVHPIRDRFGRIRDIFGAHEGGCLAYGTFSSNMESDHTRTRPVFPQMGFSPDFRENEKRGRESLPVRVKVRRTTLVRIRSSDAARTA
jgi:hypothetical protein